jgi:hypothetical protein
MGTFEGSLVDILGTLEDKELNYVLERSRVATDTAGWQNAGISRNTWYRIAPEQRDYLNNLAQQVKRQRAISAELVLMDHVEEAANVMVGLLEHQSATMKYKAAHDIMDRMLGAALQRADITSGGERIQPIATVELIKDYGSEGESEDYGDGGVT